MNCEKRICCWRGVLLLGVRTLAKCLISSVLFKYFAPQKRSFLDFEPEKMATGEYAVEYLFLYYSTALACPSNPVTQQKHRRKTSPCDYYRKKRQQATTCSAVSHRAQTKKTLSVKPAVRLPKTI